MRKLLLHAPLAVEAPKWTDPHTKANALMQAHFSRTVLAGDLAADQRTVVQQSTRLLQVSLPSQLSIASVHSSQPLCSTFQALLDVQSSRVPPAYEGS